MSAGNQLAIYLPFVLGALLVAIAIAGSRLREDWKRRAKRYLPLPVFAVVSMAAIFAAAMLHSWWQAIFLAFMTGWIANTLYHRAAGDRSRSGHDGAGR